MLVEILVIDGCPHAESAIDVVGTAAARLGIRPIVKLVEVVDLPSAAAHCFVGSPTIRVNGQDVDAASHAGEAPSLACRRYATDRGQGVTPEYRLVHEALATARAEELSRPGRFGS
jgi:hypothetical protein